MRRKEHVSIVKFQAPNGYWFKTTGQLKTLASQMHQKMSKTGEPPTNGQILVSLQSFGLRRIRIDDFTTALVPADANKVLADLIVKG